MAAYVNKVIVTGNLGADAEVRNTPSGTSVANFRIANTRKYTSNGEKKSETNWFRIVMFGKLVDSLSQYLVKGKEVHIIGRLQARQYEKDGQKQTSTEIVVEDIQLLGGGQGQGERPTSQSTSNDSSGDDEFAFDDVPF